MRERERACGCVRMCVRECACVCVCVYVYVCVCACVCVKGHKQVCGWNDQYEIFPVIQLSERRIISNPPSVLR